MHLLPYQAPDAAPTPSRAGPNAAAPSAAAVADHAFVVAYDELRRLARAQLRRERDGHTLDSVALVHEAYLRLGDGERLAGLDRAHVLALAARAMRRVLVDHARARTADKRGGGCAGLPPELLDELPAPEPSERLLALDEALERLEQVDREAARMVEYRYFVGLALPEIAEALGVSVATVRRRWSFARAWLHRALHPGPVA